MSEPSATSIRLGRQLAALEPASPLPEGRADGREHVHDWGHWKSPCAYRACKGCDQGELRLISMADAYNPAAEMGRVTGAPVVAVPEAGEAATCDHQYPPPNSDGTCPSCGKPRAGVPEAGERVCPECGADDAHCIHRTAPAVPVGVQPAPAEEARRLIEDAIDEVQGLSGWYLAEFGGQAVARSAVHALLRRVADQIGPDGRAAAWDQGVKAADDWHQGGQLLAEMPENPYRRPPVVAVPEVGEAEAGCAECSQPAPYHRGTCSHRAQVFAAQSMPQRKQSPARPLPATLAEAIAEGSGVQPST